MSMTCPPLRYRSAALLLAMLLSGCTGLTRNAHTGDAIQDAFELKQGAESPTPPEEVSQALLPPVQLQLPGVSKAASVEQRFDVKVRHVRARDFFLSLVEGTPYGMVIDPQVGGYISLDLKNITVPEVMNVVRTVQGYDYKISGHTIQVFPNTMHTRIFQVDYLAVKRAGESLTTSKTGQISNSSKGNNGSSTESLNSSTITTSSESDFWSSLKSSLTDLIGKEDGRKIAINPQTGMVMVRAMPEELRVVEEYLNASQQTLTRQVVLEARILEVALNDGFQSGINWSSLQRDGNRTLLGSQVGGGTIFSGSGITNLYSNSADLNPAGMGNVVGSTTSAFGGVFSLAVNTGDFTAFIELLKTQGDVQVLSSPRVSTVNNQKAVIKVGSDEFYVTGIDTNTTTTTVTGTTNLSVDLEPFFSGVALDVTPQISDKGDIVLHIHPAVSEVAEQTKSVTTTLGTLTLPLAASNIRESDTVIRAANGQVVVIGGLMQNITEDQDASIPLLGDIPLIGGLFKHKKKSTRKSELVILLKPVVVDEAGNVWQQQMHRASSTIRDMSQGM